MKRVSFHMVCTPDPHEKRRREILKEHPEVKTLMTTEPRTKYYIALNILLQLVAVAYAVQITDPQLFLLFAYAVGGTLNHSLFLAIHELSHNTAFKSIAHNQYMAIAANLPIGIPYASAFRRYHLQHHYRLGQELDTDIPSELECWLVSYSAMCYLDHVVRKTLYLSMYTVVYALRPVIMRPEVMQYDYWFWANLGAQAAFDLGVVAVLGYQGLLYLLLSTFLAGSLHPLSGRFLSEHLLLTEGQETYSYYGPFNHVLWQIGRHVEHHDFPNVPFTKLPQLTEIAGKHYAEPSHTSSWSETTLQFIFDDSLGPHRRVRRDVSGVKSE